MNVRNILVIGFFLLSFSLRVLKAEVVVDPKPTPQKVTAKFKCGRWDFDQFQWKMAEDEVSGTVTGTKNDVCAQIVSSDVCGHGDGVVASAIVPQDEFTITIPNFTVPSVDPEHTGLPQWGGGSRGFTIPGGSTTAHNIEMLIYCTGDGNGLIELVRPNQQAYPTSLGGTSNPPPISPSESGSTPENPVHPADGVVSVAGYPKPAGAKGYYFDAQGQVHWTF
jgi:hypothetical protein